MIVPTHRVGSILLHSRVLLLLWGCASLINGTVLGPLDRVVMLSSRDFLSHFVLLVEALIQKILHIALLLFLVNHT